MLAKLALRNVKRSSKDYLVYFFTMTVVVALMFAFNSLLFSKDVQSMFEQAALMQVMLGLATFFIIIIVAWLINYTLRFIMEKRSREFGTYLLLGMKRKQIARLYMRENVILGMGAFFAGLVCGILVQQIILSVLYSMFSLDYVFNVEMNGGCLIMTASCYAGCYLLALLRCKRKLKKMNIYNLMNAEKLNEEIKESHEEVKKWLLPVSGLFLLLFGLWLFFGKNWSAEIILLFLTGLVLVIYLFYTGLASFIVCYVRRKGALVYKGQNLFLLRQFSSKIKTMRFTMGTLTALFVLAFLGCSVAMMFNFYQDRMLEEKMPFDVQIHSGYTEEDFAAELAVIEKSASIKEAYSYHIYENGTDQVNVFLYTNLKVFGDTYKKEDGSPDRQAISHMHDFFYCTYDTFMGLTDYNRLRNMLGLEEISLEEDEYAIHIKDRVFRETGDFSDRLVIEGGRGTLQFAGYYTEPFSQDGHNGGDYVIVVPDAEAALMRPYYSELAVELYGETPRELKHELDEAAKRLDFKQAMGDLDADGTLYANSCIGSDTIMVYAADNLVRDNIVVEMKGILFTLIFPMLYMGLVFLCVALTVLSIQQLSDSAKYKFRYGVLKQIGMGTRQVARLVLKQLVLFYLCPALFAVLISGIIAGYVGGKFNFYSGAATPSALYFDISFLLFFGVYSIYFVATYVGFMRNLESWEK